MSRPGVYGWSTGSGGVHYHRVGEPLRVAAQHEIPTGTGDRLDNEVCADFDTILVHMLWDERNSAGWEELAAKGTHRLVFDIDDAMWAGDAWTPFRNHYTPAVLKRVFRNIGLAHVVTTPSPYIAEYVSQYNPNVWVVPNTVPESIFDIERPPLPTAWGGTVGYQGSSSHTLDWPAYLNGDLAKFLQLQPGWNLHLFGPDTIGNWPANRVTATGWQKPGMDYYRAVSVLDIGLAPTKKTEFNKGKSGLRAIEYAALGIVGVFADHEIYRPYVTDGITGVIIKNGQRWADALNDIANDPRHLAIMSRYARDAARTWSTENSISNWTEAWNSV